MNVETTSEGVLNAVARHRRYGRIEILCVLGLSIMIAIGGIFAAIALPTQRNINDNAEHIECIVEHIAVYNRALADALEFQIGSPERQATVAKMKAEADRLDRDCR